MLNYNSIINEEINHNGLSIREISPIMKLNLRGKKREFFTTVGKDLNMILPTKANTSAANDKLISIWLSPDEWMIISNEKVQKDTNKYDIIGKRSLYRSDTMREDRKQLVGLLTDDPNIVLEEGAQIVSELNQKPVQMLGHVTSSYFSPNLNKSIALAVVRGGKDMMDKKLFIPMKNKIINATVVNPVFFDEENKRLNA